MEFLVGIAIIAFLTALLFSLLLLQDVHPGDDLLFDEAFLSGMKKFLTIPDK